MQPSKLDDGRHAASRPARWLLGCVLACVCLLAVTGPAAGATGPGTAATAPVAAGPSAVAQQQDECFGPDTFQSVAGETVDISTRCGGYLLIGGDKTVDSPSNRNFLDLLYIPGNGRTFTVNTRLLGTDRSAYSGGVVSYTQKYGADTPPGNTAEFDGFEFVNEDGEEIAGTLAAFNEKVGIGRLPRPVQPARYRLLAGVNESLVLGNDGVPYLKGPLDRSNLRLTEPSFEGDLERTVAPKGAVDKGFNTETNRERVAVGDRVRIDGFSTAGFRGTLAAIDDGGLDQLRTLLDYPEGVDVSIDHLNPGTNQKPERVTFDSATAEDLFVEFDGNEESFSMVIDTSKETWFGQRSAAGDQYRVSFEFQGTAGREYRFPGGSGLPGPFTARSTSDDDRLEQYPYFDRDETTVESTTTFTVVKPRIEYSQGQLTGDGELIVGADGQYRLRGTTTYAPGTDIEVQLISRDGPPPTRITIDDVTIGADGSFRTPAVSYTELDPEHPVEAELFVRDRLVDRRPVVMAADPENPADLRLLDATERVTITEGETLAALSATVGNDGVADGNARVALTVDGDGWGNRSVTVTPEQNRTVAFDGARPSLPPGEYPYTVRLAGTDQSLSGTLHIEPGSATEPTTTPEPSTARPPTATPDDTPRSPPTATATPGPTTTTAANASAPSADDGSLLGGLLSYVASIAPYTLGSMVFVVVAYVVARVAVARRGGSESAS